MGLMHVGFMLRCDAKVRCMRPYAVSVHRTYVTVVVIGALPKNKFWPMCEKSTWIITVVYYLE